jgi:hypothetical protein
MTIVIFLSVGTAAWAAAANGSGQDPVGTNAGANQARLGPAPGEAAGPNGAAFKNMQAKLKERRDQFIQRQETLYNLLRDKMTPADQARYDQLVQQAKDQRAALETARTNLQKTMSDLRDLVHEYIAAQSASSSSTQ